MVKSIQLVYLFLVLVISFKLNILVSGISDVKTCFFSSYIEEVRSCVGIIKPTDKVTVISDGDRKPCDNDLSCLDKLKGKGVRVIISDNLNNDGVPLKVDRQIVNKGKDQFNEVKNPSNVDKPPELNTIVKPLMNVNNDICSTLNQDFKALSTGTYVMIGEFHDTRSIHDYINEWPTILKEGKLNYINQQHKHSIYKFFKSPESCCSIKLYNKIYYFKIINDEVKWYIKFYNDPICLNSKSTIEKLLAHQNHDMFSFKDKTKKFVLKDAITFSIESILRDGLMVANEQFSFGLFKFNVNSNDDSPNALEDPNGKGTVYVTVYDYTEESRNRDNCNKYTKFDYKIKFGDERWSLTKGDCPELAIRVRLKPMLNIQNEHDSCIHFGNQCLIYIDEGDKIIIRDKSGNDVISNGVIMDKSIDEDLFGGYSTISSRNTVGNKYAITAFKIKDYRRFKRSADYSSWVSEFAKIN